MFTEHSRERILTTLKHQEPDRVPIDLGGMLSTGITEIAYNRLKDYLKISGGTKMYDFRQQLAEPDKEVTEEVKRRIDDLAPDGGFVFAQVHNIQVDTPPENIMAMYDAVKKYGKY